MHASSRCHRITTLVVLQPIVGEAYIPAHDPLVIGRREIAHIGNVIEINLRLGLIQGRA